MKKISLPIPFIIPLDKNNLSINEVNLISNHLTNSFLVRSDNVTFERDDIDIFMGEFDFPDIENNKSLLHIYSICLFDISIDRISGKSKRRDLNRLIDIIQLKLNKIAFNIYTRFRNNINTKINEQENERLIVEIEELSNSLGNISLGHGDKKRTYAYQVLINYHFVDEMEDYFSNKILSELTPTKEFEQLH